MIQRPPQNVARGAALCAICRQAIRPDDDVVVTPDFLADESDPLWRFSDAIMHRACFLVWEERRLFIARYNRLARQLIADDGSYPFMTSEGDLVERKGTPPQNRGPLA